MQDVILHLPSWLTGTSSSTRSQLDGVTIIFFVTGNPGLIGYYEQFLQLLCTTGVGKDSIVAGASLGGFDKGMNSVWRLEDEGSEGNTSDNVQHFQSQFQHPPGFEPRNEGIYDLQDQIKLSHARLSYLARWVRDNHARVADMPIQVILVGHSVGAYIALEVVRMQHEASLSMSNVAPISVSDFRIVATMLLTPTIHNIAHSPSGRIATPVLSNIPFFPTLVQAGAGLLTSAMPASWLGGLVGRITGVTGSALNITTDFLQTPGAVRQALHLARCEMLEIGENQWSEEVWGMNEQERQMNEGRYEVWRSPKHYFLFAKEDHWVADKTRDAIVESVNGRSEVIVDEDGKLGLVHAWCLKQNGLVAGIVNKWIEDALREERV
ncbi:hypothetical protein LTR64_005214 [Lithohypha guttulata]|uniref:uncharacterized protein n=1 Tax=Lithohypha guttulata TaxID=1690604 RepID=UPI002DDF5A09|nr:hypothetical protein LTR51_002992 [Lithohypha guttulata]